MDPENKAAPAGDATVGRSRFFLHDNGRFYIAATVPDGRGVVVAGFNAQNGPGQKQNVTAAEADRRGVQKIADGYREVEPARISEAGRNSMLDSLAKITGHTAADLAIGADGTVLDRAEVPVEAPAPVPAEAPVEAPAPAPAEAPVEAPAPAPAEAPVEAPAPAKPSKSFGKVSGKGTGKGSKTGTARKTAAAVEAGLSASRGKKFSAIPVAKASDRPRTPSLFGEAGFTILAIGNRSAYVIEHDTGKTFAAFPEGDLPIARAERFECHVLDGETVDETTLAESPEQAIEWLKERLEAQALPTP